MPPFPSPAPGLYLHVPFCSAICPYCDFAVLLGGAEKRRRFVDYLLAEIALWEGEDWAPFDTVYFGGGTPSALTPEDLGRILEAVAARLPLASEPWIFLEANPEDVTPESLAAWRGLGVRTLSLGIQSFQDEALRFLGRRHTAEEARRSVLAAKEAEFSTVSVDLIYGSPGETIDSFRASLEEAVRLAPDHLSCYQLTINEGTPFGFRAARGQLVELPEPAQVNFFTFTHRFLADAGYPAYEVSSFARDPGHRSRHNAKYWHHVPYLGLGPSAHSLRGDRRFWNERKLGPYEARVAAGERPIAGFEDLTASDRALEAVMLGLRTAEGIDLGSFRERFGRDLEATNRVLLDRLEDEGLLLREGGHLVPTLAGWAVVDALAARFSP